MNSLCSYNVHILGVCLSTWRHVCSLTVVIFKYPPGYLSFILCVLNAYALLVIYSLECE